MSAVRPPFTSAVKMPGVNLLTISNLGEVELSEVKKGERDENLNAQILKFEKGYL